MGVPAESTDDRFARSDLMFPVHFDSLILGGLRTCLSDFSFFFFGHLFRGVMWVVGKDDWLGSARGNGSTKALDWRCRI